MFDVGFSEILLTAFVALVVLGPERLPKAARFAGLWLRRARAQWYSVKAELEREIAAEQFKSQMNSGLAELKQEMQPLQDAMRPEADSDEHDPDRPAQMVPKDDHFAP
jgi:sec-independent protein translocase protein TatB